MRSKKVIFLLLFFALSFLFSGCIFNRRPIVDQIPNQIGKVGLEFTYQVIAYDPEDENMTYSLTEKPEGMQIESSTGLIAWTPTENQIGAFTVELEVNDGSRVRGEKFTITVEDAYLVSVELSPEDLNISVDNSDGITSVTAFYDNETSKNIAFTDCDYVSSDISVATVSSSGVITGVSVGTATITVTYTEDDITKTDTLVVMVVDLSLTSIQVLPSSMMIEEGDSKNIASVTAYYNDDSHSSLDPSQPNYQSDDISVATVSSSGVITGISEGTAKITVTYTEEGVTRSDSVSVTVFAEGQKVLTSISVSPSSMEIAKGESESISSITANYSIGLPASIALSACTYQSSRSSVTVSNGVITVSSGCTSTTATITVSYTEGMVTKSDTVYISIPDGGG